MRFLDSVKCFAIITLMNPRKPGRPRADEARDLKTLLLDTSRQVLDEGGPSALSLRDVARRAGCTHQAPYHYFPDRESLLAALVTGGFQALTLRLAAANDLAATKGLRAALVASGQAYVGFALSQPGVFRIMFRPDTCDPSRFPELQAAGAQAYAELERLNNILYSPAASEAHALVLWAHVHGLASLALDGALGKKSRQKTISKALLSQVGELFADRMLGVKA
jgi:AcrR family transcriptional regulator